MPLRPARAARRGVMALQLPARLRSWAPRPSSPTAWSAAKIDAKNDGTTARSDTKTDENADQLIVDREHREIAPESLNGHRESRRAGLTGLSWSPINQVSPARSSTQETNPVTPENTPDTGGEAAADPLRLSRRVAVVGQFERLVDAIRTGDETMVESTVVALSQRSRWLAPLAFLVGAFVMLFQGVKLLFTNWRLRWCRFCPRCGSGPHAYLNYTLHGKRIHVLRGPLLLAIAPRLAGLTAGSYFLNAVFAFAISESGPPQIRPAFAPKAKQHLRPVFTWGVL